MFHGKKSIQRDKLSVSPPPPLSQSPVTSPYHSHSGSSTSSSQDVNSFTAIQIARQVRQSILISMEFTQSEYFFLNLYLTFEKSTFIMRFYAVCFNHTCV